MTFVINALLIIAALAAIAAMICIVIPALAVFTLAGLALLWTGAAAIGRTITGLARIFGTPAAILLIGAELGAWATAAYYAYGILA